MFCSDMASVGGQVVIHLVRMKQPSTRKLAEIRRSVIKLINLIKKFNLHILISICETELLAILTFAKLSCWLY